MCGLVSIIARKPNGFYGPNLDLFEQMLILDQLRGKDSAGAMLATKNGDQMIIKHATRHVTLMYETKEWGQFRRKAVQTGRFVVGHNRAATRGKPTSENAHPFVEGRIMLAHNGTLTFQNPKELAPERDVEVDSNAIAIALASDTPENVIPKIDGAFALIWYNNEDEKLYAIRNDQRPLHLVTTDDFYFLMSEPWMMMAPASRTTGYKVNDCTELTPGELLSFDMTGKLGRKEVALLPPKKTSTWTSDGTKDGYANWVERCRTQQDKYSDCTRQAVETGSEEDPEDSLENAIPFETGESGDPQLKHIRDILATAASRKQQEDRNKLRKPSDTCALTHGDGLKMLTSTTSKDSIEKLVDGTTSALTDVERYCEQQMANQRNIIVSNQEFKQGSFVMVKILQTTRAGKFWRWSGKIRQPGKSMLDACGVLPEHVQALDLEQWQANDVYCSGKVKFCTMTSGGPSVFVEALRPCQSVDVYADDIPSPIWNHALISKCQHCNGRVFEWERTFTRVTTKGMFTPGMASPPRNVVNVVCPDCLMKALPEGEIYDRYTKLYYEEKAKSPNRAKIDRHSALSDREPVSGEPVGKTGSIIVVPGSSTIQ